MEELLTWTGRTSPLQSVSFRYFNAAGAAMDGSMGEVFASVSNLIPTTMESVLEGGPILQVYGTDYPTRDGTCIRDYVHVDDLAEAHIRALDHLREGGTTTAINLGTGVGSSVLEVVAAIERVGVSHPSSTSTPSDDGWETPFHHWLALTSPTGGHEADALAEEARGVLRGRLRVLPFQPYDRLPEVLASADVLLALLEPDAGVYSVPSKVLTNHCAGRPTVGAIPSENLAARIIRREGSGRVTEPGDHAAFAQATIDYLEDETERNRAGHAARRYAERTFDTSAIADQFEKVLTGG